MWLQGGVQSKGRGRGLEVYLEQNSYGNLLHVFCISNKV